MGKSYIASLTLTPRVVKATSPMDVRSVVDTYDDLFSNETFKVDTGYYTYVGMVVVTKDTGNMYVLTKKPTALQNKDAQKYRDNIVWKQINVNFSELGARVVSSFDDIDTISFKYEGALAVVSDDEVSSKNGLYVYTNNEWKQVTVQASTTPSGATILEDGQALTDIVNPTKGMTAYMPDDAGTSEDEGGLYIFLGGDNVEANWKKVGGETVNNTQIINTSSNEAPASGSGLSISTVDSTDVEEVYVGDDSETGYLEANTYYTSKGLNSDLKNDGTDTDQTLRDADYIVLSSGVEGSYIRLYSKTNENWILISFANDDDESLGFKKSDVTYVDSEGNAHSMESNVLELKKKTEYISFSKNVTFKGLTETRVSGETTIDNGYVFGTTGSRYYDLDIYKENILPKVTAYVDGTAVQVLTVADKQEIIERIETSIEPEVITEPEILEMFNED